MTQSIRSRVDVLCLYCYQGKVVSSNNDHTSTISRATVLSGAEERGVQHYSLAQFLIFLIPADLRSFLRSKQLASMQYKAQGLHTFHIRLSTPFLSLNSYPSRFFKNLEIPAWPFFGN